MARKLSAVEKFEKKTLKERLEAWEGHARMWGAGVWVCPKCICLNRDGYLCACDYDNSGGKHDYEPY